MQRLIGALALAGVLALTAIVPSAGAQSFGPTVDPSTWYGPFAGPYGSIGATGFGSTGFGCGQGSLGFAAYGYGQYWGGPGYPACGGFGAYPYLYPYYVGYPYTSGTTPQGAIALSTLANPNPFQSGACNGFAVGGNFGTLGQSALFGGPAGSYSVGNNFNLLNLTNPVLSTVQNFGTFGTPGFSGCVSIR